MTATGHAVIGVVIAATISNPFIAAPLAVLSHLAADAFPHWDVGTHEKTKTKRRMLQEAFVDVCCSFIVGFSLIYFLFPQTNYFYAFCMIILAQSLDWAWAPEYFFKISNPISDAAIYLGKLVDNRMDKPWGIINQVGILVLLVVVAKIFFY